MEDQDAHFRHNLLQERVASTQEVMCRIWERSVEKKAASELTMMTPEINFMQIGVGAWPIIDSVNLDLNSKIPTAMQERVGNHAKIYVPYMGMKPWKKGRVKVGLPNFVLTMMTPEINFMQIGVGAWPIIDSVNLDLNSKIPTAMYRKNEKRQERVASTQEVMCRIWERSVEKKAASELRKMTERIRLMTDGGNQMEEIECAKKKKRKRWGYQAIRKGWSQAKIKNF
ncbi:hypothetical protein V1478_003306 [Vespula squamosa]|uniref:Uncharacterized protein n=1 Tax=Vespula squamosa TaxID=30214 RepID=A0ABD2BSB3_VESSQ